MDVLCPSILATSASRAPCPEACEGFGCFEDEGFLVVAVDEGTLGVAFAANLDDAALTDELIFDFALCDVIFDTAVFPVGSLRAEALAAG
mmetsp:Transcript_3553/g.9483  ORF Transcript_3553/g.9483 Transcript_3553/m.9483 type:complete len:90 (+) Transcript_3553:1681-1950(+)